MAAFGFITGKIIIERRSARFSSSVSAIRFGEHLGQQRGRTLPPLTTATALFVGGSSAAWKSSAAVATAPLGSGTRRVAATMARMAARISLQ
jgi:hypothetical protein